MSDRASQAAAFAACEAIRDGRFDDHLQQIEVAIRNRRQWKNPQIRPTIALPHGQVWVWLNGKQAWEIRGTGVLI